MERSLNSIDFDRAEEMYRANGYALEYGFLVAINLSQHETRTEVRSRASDDLIDNCATAHRRYDAPK
jgi:hypothetical protein